MDIHHSQHACMHAVCNFEFPSQSIKLELRCFYGTEPAGRAPHVRKRAAASTGAVFAKLHAVNLYLASYPASCVMTDVAGGTRIVPME